MAKDRLVRQVLLFMEQENLIGRGDIVVVGVSGGPDSLCLLHLLCEHRKTLGIDLHVAHLNHQLRGADADADAEFVAQYSARLGLPCTIEARDVAGVARRHKLAVEEAARRVRYAFLGEVAQRVSATSRGSARIAVAHNADDQSETVLMHWLRGAGLAGLRGMLPATRMSGLRLVTSPTSDSDLWLVRPLLRTPRADIEAYCRDRGLLPRFDRSNLDTTLYRNKLRHELLPLLENEYKPNFGQILRRSAEVARQDYDLMCEMRDRAWAEVVLSADDRSIVLDKSAWQALHLSLQRSTLRQAVQGLRRTLRDVNFEHVEAAVQAAREGRVGVQAALPRGVRLTVGYSRLFVTDAAFVPVPDWPALTVERVPLIVPGVTPLPGGVQVQIDLIARAELPSDWDRNPDGWTAYLDAAALVDAAALDLPLSLRQRRDGDRFCPLGMAGRSKPVNEFLVNEQVPAWWRDWVSLLVRGDDAIMWVCGWRVDERARITPTTLRVAVIRFIPR
ncbi:MAG: tRNA lysidine(34) synthetase TilS [Anaerolineae bacterium]|nr:tRNA lysidine(34) synthetase TilS [Anaerolineae bacterium]